MRTIAALLLLVSSGAAADPRERRDVPYADAKHERQMLDIFAPNEGKDRPVVVWIHGGGWQGGDKKEVAAKPQAFVAKGFVFVSVNYRLLPQVTIKHMAEDVAQAIRWTHDHAKEFGGDPNSILVMGHSAGAQLAALVCTDDRYLKGAGLSLSIIKGCVPVDGGTYDVSREIEMVEPARAERFKQKFGDAESQKNLSPVTHVAKGKGIPPFLILHVASDPETKTQSELLAQALQAAGVSAKVYSADDTTHVKLDTNLGLPDDQPTKALFDFVDGLLK